MRFLKTSQLPSFVAGWSVADRRIVCTALRGSTTIIRTRVRFVDEGGNDPGAEVEIIDREIVDRESLS